MSAILSSLTSPPWVPTVLLSSSMELCIINPLLIPVVSFLEIESLFQGGLTLLQALNARSQCARAVVPV